MILPNGTLLQGGKYRIEEKIGQGGFGITYRACQPLMLDRKVCIKEFYLKQCFSRESTSSAITYPNDSARKDAEVFQQKFIKEAQTLYSMHHPNIMEIYDIFEENNTAYYVMEYIEGESLKDMLERRGSIPEAEAIGYIRKVAEALKYIHSRNFNHFDVKPDNILVRSSDKEVILIDFGTAKHYDSNTGNATTMTAGLLSRGYAPIEQYKEGGVNTFTPETDIYALGATLYKLLTGNTPPEPTEIISNGIPELPSSVSQATKDLIKWAMQLNKADRPHSCDEFMNALPVSTDCDMKNGVSKGDNAADDATIISSLETENMSEETKSINKDATSDMTASKEEPHIDAKRSKKKSKKPLFIVVLLLAFVGIVAYFSYGSSKRGVYEAELKDDIDTLSYCVGLAQTQGLKEYLVENMGVDTAYIDYFIEGLSAGAECGDNKDSVAYYSGIQIGQQISHEMIKGINKELYGSDTTKSISLKDFLDGFTAGSTGNNQLMTVEQAVEKSQRLMEEAKEQHRKDSIARLK